ncbi:MAG: IPT/TIG domain-containing protein, partial [Bryobacterales bacterium]|nr:IPT/TIG domain-containing protein [Bryobacterales bacterium]
MSGIVVRALLLCVLTVLPAVGQGTFTLTPAPGSQTVWQAQSTSYLITVTPSGGFTGTVGFTVAGLPTGASAGFAPATVVTSGTTTLTVAAGPGTPVGTSTLTITGSSGGTTATATVSLQVVVPPPITYGYDAVGRLRTVTNQWGESATYNYDAVGNILSITRQGAQQITVQAFAPASAFAGTNVTILGSAFSTMPAQNTVKFNGVTATVVSASATQLVATVPGGATSGTISVTNANGTATSAQTFTVLSALGTPSISSITPQVSPSSGLMQISGANFVAGGGNTVKIGPVTLGVLDATSTTINAVLPGQVGSGKVTVQTAFGTGTSTPDFIFVPAPYRTADVTLATRATLDTVYTTNFTRSGQAALFIFDATAGQKVRLNLITAGQDNKVAVYGPDGGLVMADVQLFSGKTLETPALPSTGTYTVLLKGTVTTLITGNPYTFPGVALFMLSAAPATGDFQLTAIPEPHQTYWQGPAFRVIGNFGPQPPSTDITVSVSGLPSGVTANY